MNRKLRQIAEIAEKLFVEQRRVVSPIVASQFAQIVAHNVCEVSAVRRAVDEYNAKLYTTRRVPTHLRPLDIKVMWNLPEHSQRIEYLDELFVREVKRWNVTRLKQHKNRFRSAMECLQLNGDSINGGVFSVDGKNNLIYALNHNCLALEMREKHLHKCAEQKLRRAQQFGPHIVIDFSCAAAVPMDAIDDLTDSVRQICEYNRDATLDNAFALHFTGLDDTSEDVRQCVADTIDDIQLNEHMIANKSSLNPISNSNLVFVSQFGEQPLEQFDTNVVYVIPAVTQPCAATAATNARQRGMQLRRLPLHEFGFFSIDPAVIEFVSPAETFASLLYMSCDNQWSQSLSAALDGHNCDVARKELAIAWNERRIRRAEVWKSRNATPISDE